MTARYYLRDPHPTFVERELRLTDADLRALRAPDDRFRALHRALIDRHRPLVETEDPLHDALIIRQRVFSLS